MPSQVVVAGHFCLDLIPAFSAGTELPAPGQLVPVGAAIFSTGGTVSNTGVALHILGVDTQLRGKVGDDPFGQIVLDLIRARGPKLADGILIAPGETTSYTIVLNLPGRDRSFLYYPGANDTFRVSDLDLDAIARARLFHFGYPSLLRLMYENDGVELRELFRTVKGLGVTTSLDMAMIDPSSLAARANWAEILGATLPYVDVFLPSIEEMLLFLRRAEFEWLSARGSVLEQLTPSLVHEFAEQLLAWGPKIVGLKMGTRGLYLRTAGAEKLVSLGPATPPSVQAWAERELWAPIFQVEQFVGATGSGDATIAGFLAALLAGRSPEDTVRFACAVGACNVEAADALGGLRSWNETWARLNSGWPRVALQLDDPAWRFDAAQQLWRGPGDSAQQ